MSLDLEHRNGMVYLVDRGESSKRDVIGMLPSEAEGLRRALCRFHTRDSEPVAAPSVKVLISVAVDEGGDWNAAGWNADAGQVARKGHDCEVSAKLVEREPGLVSFYRCTVCGYVLPAEQDGPNG